MAILRHHVCLEWALGQTQKSYFTARRTAILAKVSALWRDGYVHFVRLNSTLSASHLQPLRLIASYLCHLAHQFTLLRRSELP